MEDFGICHGFGASSGPPYHLENLVSPRGLGYPYPRRLFVVEKGKIAGRVTQTGLFERMLAVMTDLSSVAGQL